MQDALRCWSTNGLSSSLELSNETGNEVNGRYDSFSAIRFHMTLVFRTIRFLALEI